MKPMRAATCYRVSKEVEAKLSAVGLERLRNQRTVPVQRELAILVDLSDTAQAKSPLAQLADGDHLHQIYK